MLVSLKASLQHGFSSLIYTEQEGLQEHNKHIDHIKRKMDDLFIDRNEVEQESELTWIKNKIADLEDRSRCNNPKIRGIPDPVCPCVLIKYLQGLILTAWNLL